MRMKVTDEIREAARRLERSSRRNSRKLPEGFDLSSDISEYYKVLGDDLFAPIDYDAMKLNTIADGKQKTIDPDWWQRVHRTHLDRGKRDKLSALADPNRNTNEHERRVAANMLAQYNKARSVPGLKEHRRREEEAALRAAQSRSRGRTVATGGT
jgi:hypothetical protein